MTTGESFLLASVPFVSRAAPSTTAASPILTPQMSPVSITVAPAPIVPRSEEAASAKARAKPLSFSMRTGLWRYIASR